MKKRGVKKINKKNKITLLMVALWLLLFLFVSYGYASFTSTLDINATALMEYTELNENFDISEMGVNSSSGASSMSLSHVGTEVKGTVYTDICGGYVIYSFTLQNKSPYLAYISNINVKSLTNSEGNPTTGFDVEMINVTPNEDYIDAYQSRIIQVKITNNCSTNDTLANFIFEFEFNLVKYHTYTISANYSDAEINVTTSRGKTYTGIGSVVANIYEEDTINYSVGGDNYFTVTGTDTMATEDLTRNVTLTKAYTLTVTSTPSSKTVICHSYDDGSFPVASLATPVSVKIAENTHMECSVAYDDQDYYYTQLDNGNLVGYWEEMTMTADKTIDVTLQEKPWITGSYTNTDQFTANNGSLTNYRPGYYLIELWGGTGGIDRQGKSTTSVAGYIYATVYIPNNSVIYYSLGGNGEDGNANDAAQGGANGGADGPAIYPGAGGGYSAIAINATSIDESTINSGNVLMIAGGGGGSGAGYLPTSTPTYGPGGSGGLMSATMTQTSIGYVYHGTDGAYGNKYVRRAGKGGSTTGGEGGGASNDSDGVAGSLLKGGEAGTGSTWNNGGAGGAGYYGGGGGAGKGTASDGCGSGGGGSSLISTVLGLCTPGNGNNVTLTGTNPSSTGGSVVITWAGKTLSN